MVLLARPRYVASNSHFYLRRFERMRVTRAHIDMALCEINSFLLKNVQANRHSLCRAESWPGLWIASHGTIGAGCTVPPRRAALVTTVGRRTMPKFMLRVSYTAAGMKGVQKNTEEQGGWRREEVAYACKALGGKLDAIYFS